MKTRYKEILTTNINNAASKHSEMSE